MDKLIENIISRIEPMITNRGFGGTIQQMYADAKLKTVIDIIHEEVKEYNNGWIPCSERMPNKKEYLKNDGRFIVTDGNRSYQSIYDIYCDVFRTFRMYNIGKECIYDQDDCVIAWMPLPPIYQQKEVSHVRL